METHVVQEVQTGYYLLLEEFLKLFHCKFVQVSEIIWHYDLQTL